MNTQSYQLFTDTNNSEVLCIKCAVDVEDKNPEAEVIPVALGMEAGEMTCCSWCDRGFEDVSVTGSKWTVVRYA